MTKSLETSTIREGGRASTESRCRRAAGGAAAQARRPQWQVRAWALWCACGRGVRTAPSAGWASSGSPRFISSVPLLASPSLSCCETLPGARTSVGTPSPCRELSLSKSTPRLSPGAYGINSSIIHAGGWAGGLLQLLSNAGPSGPPA